MFDSEPVIQHHIGSDNKFLSSYIFHSKIIEEPNQTNTQSNEKTQCPLHTNVLVNLHSSSTSPILLEKIILNNSANITDPSKFNNKSIKEMS